MSELSPMAKRLLGEYCEATEAPPGAGRRGGRALGERVVRTRTRERRIAVAATVFAAAAAVVAALALRRDPSPQAVGHRHGFEASQDHAASPSRPERAVRAAAPRTSAPPTPPTAAESDPPVRHRTESEANRFTRPAIDRETKSRPVATATEDALALETALIGQARAALRRGDDPAVLVLLQRHRDEFPDGALVHERSAWEAIAMCRDERPAAEPTMRAFLRAHPESRWTESVLRACSAFTSGDGTPAPGSTTQ